MPLTRILAAVAPLLLAGSAIAQESIILGIGSASSSPGATVEIPVTLEAATVAPQVILLFVAYDSAKLQAFSDYYEFVATDLAGNPVRDENDNVIVTRGAARPEQSLIDAQKVVDTQVLVAQFPAGTGVLGVSIAGLNALPIPNGLILTLGFRVLEGLGPNETIALRGVDASDPVFIQREGTDATDVTFSSASTSTFDQQATQMVVQINDGSITTGCTNAPAAPTNVTATQGNPDVVTISWDAVPGAQYRVFRGTDSNLNAALPLGTAWQVGATFTDITASAPVVAMAEGCSCEGSQEVVRYFYWVKARSAEGCESGFSDPPAEGFRGEGKSFTLTTATSGPATRAQWLVFAMLFSVLAVARPLLRKS